MYCIILNINWALAIQYNALKHWWQTIHLLLGERLSHYDALITATAGILPALKKKITPPSLLALMMQLGLSGKENFRSFMKISADMMVMMVNWLWWKGSLRSFMKTSTEQKVWLPFSPRRRLVLFIFSRQLRPPHTSQIKLLSSKSCPRILLPYETSLLIAWKVSLTVWK